MLINKRCNKSGCRELIDVSETYCDKHRNDDYKQYNKARYRNEPEYIKLYSSTRWRELRYQKLLDEGFMCRRCNENGIIKEADMVDHIVPVRQDWNKRFDWDNLQPLCWACHNTKTAEDERK